jgi:hypothetical protein
MQRSRLIALTALLIAFPAAAQTAAKVDTGMAAPAFSAPGATKDGLLKSVSLGDYRGKTVVIAFFYRARSKG